MSPGKIRPNTANVNSNNRSDGGMNVTTGGIISSFDTTGGTFGPGNSIGFVNNNAGNTNKPAYENVGLYLGDAKPTRGDAAVMGTYICVCTFCVCV